MKDLKVMFFVASWGSGLGGHGFSLRALAEALQSKARCTIVDIGRVPTQALAGSPVPQHCLFWRPSTLPQTLHRLNGLVGRENPDVLHSFDLGGNFFAQLMACRHKKPLVHTKCGGPNPQGHFPRQKQLVLFSVENFEFFASNPRFRDSRLQLIPGRVREPRQDSSRVGALKAKLDPKAMCVLRIGRITPGYERVSLQAMALVERLRRDNIPAQFVHVGTIQDPVSYKRIQDALGPQDLVLTTSEFTRTASELLQAGDFVVGTGRSLMEAAAVPRILLAPLAEGTYPALVTAENWKHLFQTNFSSRGKIPGFDDEQNYAAIVSAIRSPDQRKRLLDLARHLFETEFSLAGAVERHLALYRGIELGEKIYPVDMLRQAFRLLRSNRGRESSKSSSSK